MKEILPCVTTWMGLEGTMLSEISQTEKDNYHIYVLAYGIYFSLSHLILLSYSEVSLNIKRRNSAYLVPKKNVRYLFTFRH